jgi:hypothetical protein
LSTAGLLQQIQEGRSVIDQEPRQQRWITEVKDVHSVEAYLLAREHSVSAGVMPERPVAARQLQDDGVRSGCSGCSGDVLQVHSVLGQ